MTKHSRLQDALHPIEKELLQAASYKSGGIDPANTLRGVSLHMLSSMAHAGYLRWDGAQSRYFLTWGGSQRLNHIKRLDALSSDTPLNPVIKDSDHDKFNSD